MSRFNIRFLAAAFVFLFCLFSAASVCAQSDENPIQKEYKITIGDNVFSHTGTQLTVELSNLFDKIISLSAWAEDNPSLLINQKKLHEEMAELFAVAQSLTIEEVPLHADNKGGLTSAYTTVTRNWRSEDTTVQMEIRSNDGKDGYVVVETTTIDEKTGEEVTWTYTSRPSPDPKSLPEITVGL